MGDVKQEVEKWVEASGRALELRVARTLRQVGEAEVELGYNYTDVATGVVRESDVVAGFPWLGAEKTPCRISLAVECKNSKKHPWVAFYSGHEAAPRPELEDWVYFAHGPFLGITQALPEKWLGHAPFVDGPVATHVVAAHESDGRNTAGDAVRQILSCAAALRRSYIDNQHKQPRVGLICMAAIVTAAPLLTCELDENGAVNVREVDGFDVWGYSVEGRRQRVYVRSESSLPAFAEALKMRAIAAGAQ